MLLQIDVGNTRLKWRAVGAVDGSTLASGFLNRADSEVNAALFASLFAVLRHEFGDSFGVDGVQVASVAGAGFDCELADWASIRLGVAAAFAVVTERASGVLVGYDDPGLLGVDRWLAVLAATKVSNYKKVLVVDCGSAITVDVLDEGVHRGGYIVPGLRLMVGALFSDTSQVKVAALAAGEGLGRNTSDAVNSGVLLMAVSFIEGVSRRYCSDAVSEWLLLLTGGDAQVVASKLDLGVATKVSESLVLDGLSLSELVLKR